MSRTNEKRTVVHEYNDLSVVVSYFWVDGEQLTDITSEVDLPEAWIHAKARVDLLEFTENFESLGNSMDFKTLQLYVNDEYVGELLEIKEDTGKFGSILKCKVAVGAG
jgi:hypothetical protein